MKRIDRTGLSPICKYFKSGKDVCLSELSQIGARLSGLSRRVTRVPRTAMNPQFISPILHLGHHHKYQLASPEPRPASSFSANLPCARHDIRYSMTVTGVTMAQVHEHKKTSLYALKNVQSIMGLCC